MSTPSTPSTFRTPSTLRALSARTLKLMEAASRATERAAQKPTPKTVAAEREAWEAYARARRAEVEERLRRAAR